MKIFVLEDLEVYQLSVDLADDIWSEVVSWSYFPKITLGKQLVEAADSISANIAEGYGRYFYKENRQFCFYSRGSILETKTWLLHAKNRNLITEEQYKTFNEHLTTIHIKLNAYIKYIGKTQNSSNPPDSQTNKPLNQQTNKPMNQ